MVGDPRRARTAHSPPPPPAARPPPRRPPQVKCAVLGAAGGIGQPLALLVKGNPDVSELSLYDVVNTPGVAADLSHINTKAKVSGYIGDAQLEEAVTGCDIVVIPAGVPRKPGMTRDDLFNINAGIVRTLVTAIAKCVRPFICIISNPVNSTVPIAAEVLKKAGVYDPKRLFGISTLDVVRASTFVAEVKGTDPVTTKVTVVGGHSGVTILPLLSQTGLQFTQEEIEALTKRIQYGGDEVVKAKNGTGSATLSMAYAGYRFVESLMRAAFKGEKGVVECTYVDSDQATKDGVSFFAGPVELGPSGVEKILPIGSMSPYEQELYKAAIGELKANIVKGTEFVTKA
ncbi:malate dehydrogenase [Hyaloraphidium curvatum]|nr:malate dehydrogenase [Hyaloraphidium curvatum]